MSFLVDEDMNEIKSTPKDFLSIDMKKRVIKNIVLNPIDESYKYSTYKVVFIYFYFKKSCD